MPHTTKSALRKHLRDARRTHVAVQPEATRALLFNRPPRPLIARFSETCVIGLYSANAEEAPASGYARFFYEEGHRIALPFFAERGAAMQFREHADPFDETDLSAGPFGILQPPASAALLIPDIVFVPLIGVTADGDRLGQGGGHYDRWLAEHPGRMAIGLAWDVQVVDAVPCEPHDMQLDAVITPTRMYGLD
ncbi:MAG: 5-formyltetrahydrofolate cyclo-ligase [Pseudomonadota bacterium]